MCPVRTTWIAQMESIYKLKMYIYIKGFDSKVAAQRNKIYLTITVWILTLQSKRTLSWKSADFRRPAHTSFQPTETWTALGAQMFLLILGSTFLRTLAHCIWIIFGFFSHLQVHGTMIRSGFSILRRQMREMMMCAYDVYIYIYLLL